MINSELPIYLASKSPRRKKLLNQLNLKFHTLSVDINEDVKDHETPLKTVKRLASEKLNAARKLVKNGIIITADTIVVIDGKIIGKPKDQAEAGRYLKRLSGRTHTVYTGFAVYNSTTKKLAIDYEKTEVTFRKLGIKEIQDYIATGSPFDKAGAYGIQDDFGAVFVTKINGCYYNVVGLPLTKLYLTLLGII